MSAVSFSPCAVAVIVTGPTLSAITCPVDDTVAIDESEDAYVIGDDSGAPPAPCAAADSCRCSPMWIVAVSGVMSNVTTGAETVRAIVALKPLTVVARIVEDPLATPVTLPSKSIVAFAVLSLLQPTGVH